MLSAQVKALNFLIDHKGLESNWFHVISLRYPEMEFQSHSEPVILETLMMICGKGEKRGFKDFEWIEFKTSIDDVKIKFIVK